MGMKKSMIEMPSDASCKGGVIYAEIQLKVEA
jgi:hypothetical protein